MLAKFQGNQRSIVMSLTNCLNSSFCNLKLYIKYYFMNQMVNYIWLASKLRIYRTCNLTTRFLKCKFNKKLLSGVTLSNVIPINGF